MTEPAPSKQVWIVNHYGQTRNDRGGLTRHYDFSSHFEKHGWKATIIAANTNHPSGRNRHGKLFWPRLETVGGVDFLWVPSTPYSGNGVARILNMVVFFLVLLLPWSARSLGKPEVVVGSSPHPLAAAAGALLAKRHGVPFIYEVRDPWPEALIDMGRIRRDSMMAKVMFRLERWLYKNSTSSIGLWPLLADYTTSIGLDHLHTHWISNGVDPKRFHATEKAPEPGKFTLMYFGAHGGANGLENVIRAMEIVGRSPEGAGVMLRLVGDGPNKPELMALCEKLGCRNIVFLPPVVKDAIPEIAAEADAFVFNLLNAPMFRFGISPNKLFEYMAAARPVLFCCNAASNPVVDSQCGIQVPPDNPAALAEAIIVLAQMAPEKRALMGNAGRRYIEENFAIPDLAYRFVTVLDKAVI